MAKINVLPQHIAELIAAGEVVERPSSVVKELTENSIDAGADRITVEIKNGGIRYIRITDNGCGIGRDDIRNAFVSHATSKIKISEDLDCIKTLGFRGEALASIASVSKVEVLTKEADALTGTRFVIEGGKEILCDDAGCPDGTTVIIRDIFYNTPARMKFLKKDSTEGNYISDLVEKIAVSHPGISFRLIKDNKTVIATNGNGDLKNAVYSVYGKDFSNGLINCEYELNGIKIKGFVTKPTEGRATRSMQFVYVNGRYVRVPVVASALDNAYKNSITAGKYPSCILFITVNPETVDVNVHPAKTEVRFSDERKIYEAVYYCAVSALSNDTSVPQVKITLKTESNSGIFGVKNNTEQLKISENYSYTPQVKTENAIPVTRKNIDIAFDENDVIPSEPLNGIFRLRDTSSPDISYDKDDGLDIESLMNVKKSEDPVPEIIITDESDRKNTAGGFRIIGEIFNTYIIAEAENKVYFVDKHASHERIIFNSLKNRDAKITSQLLICPVTVSLSKREYEAVIDNKQLFEEAGYGIDDFGEGCVAVRECPVELSEQDISYIVNELAGQLVNGTRTMSPEKLDRLYYSTACRAAVKAGDDLTDKEKEELVRQVLNDENVRFCPHGRPVMIEMTKYELEKQFGRIQ